MRQVKQGWDDLQLLVMDSHGVSLSLSSDDIFLEISGPVVGTLHNQGKLVIHQTEVEGLKQGCKCLNFG